MDDCKDHEDADTISVDTLALEEMVHQDRVREINQLHALSNKVSFIHSDLLYFRSSKSPLGSCCYEAWKILVKKVGGTPNGWRELGYSLGVSHDDLNYIMHSVKEDPVDMVLKVFRQNENATLDKIIDSFLKLKRYDIVKAIENPLCDIAQYFNKDDSGYYSKEKGNGQREIVSLKNVRNDLPAALNKNIVSGDKDPKKPKEPALTLPANKTENKTNENTIFFLTYAQDGLPTAINIQEYVDNWSDVPNVKVITLNSRREELYQNPEKFIREYFEKANIIIPIITPGYIEEIRSHNPNVPNTSDNLDHRYASFIYNLIVNNYIHATGCLNKNVRSVLPQNSNVDLFTTIISMYPDLLPWTYETNFDEQFKAFLNAEYS